MPADANDGSTPIRKVPMPMQVIVIDEGVFAADEITDVPEEEGAERTHREAGGEGQQGEDEGGRRFHAGEELLREDRGESAVDVEIVPLEYGSHR